MAPAASKARAQEQEEEGKDEEAGSGSGEEAGSGEDEDGESAEEEGSEDEGDEEGDSESSPEPEARVLPQRATRGNRMQGVMEEEDEADQQFWGQDFFQEEEKDTDWESSGDEVKDTVDSDFDLSEDEGEEDGDKDEPKERKAKALQPPGAQKRKKPPLGPSKARLATAKAPPSPATQADRAFAAVQAPKLRASTRARVEVAKEERVRQEQVAKKRPKPAAAPEFKPLTQEELLAEAAKTELENEKSLQMILAREEEVKKRQAAAASERPGPTVRYHSRTLGSGADANEAAGLFMMHATEFPPRLQAQRAPPHPPRQHCCITGLPAKYRHPETRAPYATAAAFAQLESNGGHPYGAPPQPITDADEVYEQGTKRRRPGGGGHVSHHVSHRQHQHQRQYMQPSSSHGHGAQQQQHQQHQLPTHSQPAVGYAVDPGYQWGGQLMQAQQHPQQQQQQQQQQQAFVQQMIPGGRY